MTAKGETPTAHMTASPSSDVLRPAVIPIFPPSTARILLFLSLLVSIPAIFEVPKWVSATGILLLAAMPVMFAWHRYRRLLVADPIIVLGAVWVIAVTLPVYFPSLYKDRQWYELSPWLFDYAALWIYRGWATFSLAYWLAHVMLRRTFAMPRTKFDEVLATHFRRAIGVLGIIGSLIYIYYTRGFTHSFIEEIHISDSTGRQILFLLKELSHVYVFLYFSWKNHEKMHKADKYILYAVILLVGIIFMSSGSKFTALTFMAAWLLGHAARPGRGGFLRELWLIGLSLVMLVAVFFLVAEYRSEFTNNPPPTNASTSTVITHHARLMLNAAVNLISGKPLGQSYYGEGGYDASNILDRLAHLSTLAYFWSRVGLESPHEHALNSLLTPIWAFVPRSIYPSKPKFLDSGDFARNYAGWSYGGISISTPGSLFWAWGYAGIVLGMMAFGWILAWLWLRSNGLTSKTLIIQSVLITMVLLLLNGGVTFQMVVVPVMRTFVLLLFVRTLIRLWLSQRKSIVLAAH